MKNQPLPKTLLAYLPTPVERMHRLSQALAGPELWIKRDDQTGLAFGGNKTRKLELLVAAALEQGAARLITRGAVQSNHCRQTAAAAARLGLGCTLVLTGSPPDRTRANLLLDRLLGAEIVWTGERPPDQVLEETFQEGMETGAHPYLIPYGGSSPLGAAAYALAVEELAAQEPGFDRIVFATSSGGTQSGMLVGVHLLGLATRVHGISVEPQASKLKPLVARLAAETAELMETDLPIGAEEVLVNDDFLGGGYAVMGEPEREAIGLFARTQGILLDPVYTGRAAAGLIALIRSGEIHRDEKVLFWHTGGTPALFAYEEKLVPGG
jgi:L-cysteate sulfo-lyase